MTDIEELKKAKARCIADLTEHLTNYADRLNEIDTRLVAYIEDALSNNASHANLFELLGIRKTLRLMDSYNLDIPRARRKITAIEGIWENGRHLKGGLKFSTPRGQQHVRLMPFQVYAECTIHMFVVDVNMERRYYEGDRLLPTEWVGADGNVWDTRRLCKEAHWFFTRKSGKTELGAAEDFTEVCFLGDINGQALICTNSAEQSQIAFKAIKGFAAQIDPTCLNRMGGKFFKMTRNGLKWQPGHRMEGEIKCLSAGKTSKDGLYASVVHADEHGQARYIGGTSDMQSTVETAWGSTGPRREKLLLHTTTAGRIKDGPYKRKLEQVEESLLRELDFPLGEPHRTEDDSWTAMMLQLDKWEVTDELDKLNDPELFKKVNRSIGTTVQPTYYRERLYEAATGTEDTKQEVLTKDFNIWQGVSVQDWIKPEKVRPLQREMRIDECTENQGWLIFTGMDFSQGDDLHTAAWLACRRHPSGRGTEFFADFDAWMKEDSMQKSAIRPLLESWVEQGWLHVSPGEVFQPSLFTDRLLNLWKGGCRFMFFGYDKYRSSDPINTLKSCLQTNMGIANPEPYVQVVSQLNSELNAPTDDLYAAMFAPVPFISFSHNPMWPWLFGNAVLEIDGRENKRPVKRSQSDSCKIDPVQAIIVAMDLYERHRTMKR